MFAGTTKFSVKKKEHVSRDVQASTKYGSTENVNVLPNMKGITEEDASRPVDLSKKESDKSANVLKDITRECTVHVSPFNVQKDISGTPKEDNADQFVPGTMKNRLTACANVSPDMKDNLSMGSASHNALTIRSGETDNANVLQAIKLLTESVLIVQDTHNISTEYVFAIMVILLLMAPAKGSPVLIQITSTIPYLNHANARVHWFG